MMPRRASSPAVSENEFDISNVLLAGSEDKNEALLHRSSKQASTSEHGVLDGQQSDESGDEAFIALKQAASNRKTPGHGSKTLRKGGGFQAMGLDATLLKAISRKGFSVPTPIQRKTIPLILEDEDVVGMARTGSGKTAAFVIPLIQKLKTHSAKVGARAVVFSPSRELALQTLKVIKELARGTDLRTVLLVGGDSLEDDFGLMASNPDIIIATPGRFLHLKVEMNLDLSSVTYVVFDEADRLFEMGFAVQLTEIIHALPLSRQTLLFSATLPKSLVEFTRAGLQEPKLVRLDAESKISPDLESAFFTVKSAEKDGALLHLLQDVIKMPLGRNKVKGAAGQEADENGKKRKRIHKAPVQVDSPSTFSTIIFAATKHHVEYLTALLRAVGYSVSYAYGSLDQTARNLQTQEFRAGITNILVVTDVAARGIDIPVLANVINYDFPSQPKIFVHRVGRTARAGRRGWSYSLVRDADLPYLLDLQLFLSRKLVIGRDRGSVVNFAADVVVGGLIRDRLESSCEWVSKLLSDEPDLAMMREVAMKGEKLYIKSRSSASSESAKRAKVLAASSNFADINMLFNDDSNKTILERERLLARVSGYRPQETVFEIGKRGVASEAAEMMKKRRQKLDPRKRRKEEDEREASAGRGFGDDQQLAEPSSPGSEHVETSSSSESELEVTISNQTPQRTAGTNTAWQDAEHFMSYLPVSTNMAEERGYGVHSGTNIQSGLKSSFLEAARGEMMDLGADEAKAAERPSTSRGMRWDKKSKKYVARINDADGSKGAKMIRGESGQKIASSFKSGRFDAWKKSNRIGHLPRTGEQEVPSTAAKMRVRQYKHKVERAPKEADKFRDDYHKRKKRVEEAKEKRVGRFRDGNGNNELRGVDEVRKRRRLQEHRRAKNARPSKRKPS